MNGSVSNHDFSDSRIRLLKIRIAVSPIVACAVFLPHFCAVALGGAYVFPETPNSPGPSRLAWEKPGVLLFTETTLGHLVRLNLNDQSTSVIYSGIHFETRNSPALMVDSERIVWISNPLVSIDASTLEARDYGLQASVTGLVRFRNDSLLYVSSLSQPPFARSRITSLALDSGDADSLGHSSASTRLESGEVYTLSPPRTVSKGKGPEFGEIADMDSDQEGRLVVVDTEKKAVMRVDPESGDRALISNQTIGSGIPIVRPLGLVIGRRNEIFVADAGSEEMPPTIMRVSPDTGDRTIISSVNHGSGLSFLEPVDLVIDEDGTLIVSDTGRDTLFRVDPATGNREVLWQMAPQVSIRRADSWHLEIRASGSLEAAESMDGPWAEVSREGYLLLFDKKLKSHQFFRAVSR